MLHLSQFCLQPKKCNTPQTTRYTWLPHSQTLQPRRFTQGWHGLRGCHISPSSPHYWRASPQDTLYISTLQFNLLSYGVISQTLFNYYGIKALLKLSPAFVRARQLMNTTGSSGHLQGSIPHLFILNNVLICNWCCQNRKGIKRADASKKKAADLTVLNGTLRTLNLRYPSSGVDTLCQTYLKCGFITEVRRSPMRSKALSSG